jgi:hypothetical protein
VDDPPPADQFRLYAVCARLPRDLAERWREVRPGVFDCLWGSKRIRVVVLRQLPREEHNAALHLFTASPELVQYGADRYRPHSSESSTLLSRLAAGYRGEGFSMPYTMEEFMRDAKREILLEMTPEERLAGLAPEERLAGLTPEQVLDLLTPEQVERYLQRRRHNPPPPEDSGTPTPGESGS